MVKNENETKRKKRKQSEGKENSSQTSSSSRDGREDARAEEILLHGKKDYILTWLRKRISMKNIS